MAWKLWNKKQKKVFIIIIIVTIILLILLLPILKGANGVGKKAFARIFAILYSVGIIQIIKHYQYDYEESISEGNCIKCNKSCQTTYYEKNDMKEYDCQSCGKYKM